MSTTTTHQSEAERVRRRELVRDMRAANQRGISIEQREKQRADAAAEWTQWLHQKMESSGCTDPVELLPDILAKIEQTIDDRVAAAIAEIKQTLRKAMS
jgi:hypothetical protein